MLGASLLARVSGGVRAPVMVWTPQQTGEGGSQDTAETGNRMILM
jgi:hypothetical protein